MSVKFQPPSLFTLYTVELYLLNSICSNIIFLSKRNKFYLSDYSFFEEWLKSLILNAYFIYCKQYVSNADTIGQKYHKKSYEKK